MLTDQELIADLKDIITTGASISYLDTGSAVNKWRIIGTTGNIIKLFSGTGAFQLLSFAQLAQFAREGRLKINGKLYLDAPRSKNREN
jgi:hypothetical protein